MSGGRLIAVVGPSGVGKDSVMAGIADAVPEIRPVRRSVTRAPGLGGEDYHSMTPETFAQAVADGAFCLHWYAHGLRYGIPACVLERVRAGETRMANLSRAVLAQADRAFPRLIVLSLTARPETLVRRLSGRGRESAAEIGERLSRTAPLPAGLEVVEIANDGPLAETVEAARAALQPTRA
jgi:ribose 1,5-bisphosphokinase